MQIDAEALAAVGTIGASLVTAVGLLWKRNVQLERIVREDARERLAHVQKMLESSEAREREHRELLERIEATQRVAMSRAPTMPRGPMGSNPGRTR